MSGFNLTAQEIAGWLPVIAGVGVLIETTISRIRADRKKQRPNRPSKAKKKMTTQAKNKPV